MTSIGVLLTVLLGFGIAFVLLPWLVLPRPKSARNKLDVIFINFVRWIAIVIAGTHVLVSLRLYESIAIGMLCLFGFWYTKLRPRGWTASRTMKVGHEAILRLVRFGDRVERRGYRRAVKEREGFHAKHDKTGNPSRLRRALSGPRVAQFAIQLAIVAPILIVLGAAFVLREQLPAQHAPLTPSDAYVHMTWAKKITINELYPDGVYPMGMASILAFLSKFCFRVDMFDVVRFAGPITGMLIVLGIFYTTLRLTRNPGAATFAAGTFGLFGTRPEWHEPWTRQIGALPQEFSLGIAILALAFVGLCVARKERDHLFTVFAATLAMGMTHPVPLAIFLFSSTFLAFGVGIFVPGGIAMAFRCQVTAGVGAAVGLIFIPIARLFGVPFYKGLGDFNPFARGKGVKAGPLANSVEAIGHNHLTRLAGVATLVGFIGGLVQVFNKPSRVNGAKLIGISLCGATFLALYDVRWLGLDPFYSGRAANVVGPAIAIAFGAGVGALSIIVMKRFTVPRASVMLAAGLFALLLFAQTFPVSASQRTYDTIEYDAVPQVTRLIKQKHERLAYTIVGTPEQRQLTMGDGWHVEEWVFARDVQLRDARDPLYDLPIPTDDIYITVEKVPFPAGILDASRGTTEEFYRNPVVRGRMMTVVYRWCETYERYHTDMSVFYNDSQVRVYHVHRPADVDAGDDSKQFKNYRAPKPGTLFQTGPERASEVQVS